MPGMRHDTGDGVAVPAPRRMSSLAFGSAIERLLTFKPPQAELIGVTGSDPDSSERAIRWLIALLVLCCDPLATALTSSRP